MAGWKDRWKKGTKLGTGGNGTTYVAVRADGSDPTERALKLLHNPEGKRAHMRREIANLQRLLSDVEGVPRIIDAIAEDANDDVAPFIVMEKINGPTLEQACAKRRFALDAALDLTLALLLTLERCHEVGVIHRDVKHDNTMLRDGDPTRPVLIDFGLSVEEDDPRLTSNERQVGNRFLGLPEHQTPGSEKRDKRSDLTQCCGILFYALTGVQPMTLVDEHGVPPHRRTDVKEFLAPIPPDVLVRLSHVFDVGFKQNIGDRWQDCGALRRALIQVREPVRLVPPLPSIVRSLWTLHAAEARPTALYFNHRLVGGGELERFFKSPGENVPFDRLEQDVREAALSVWEEVNARTELRSALRNRHALDHLCHDLMNGDPSQLRWNQEIQYPNDAQSTRPVPIEIDSLSLPGQAAVGVLDRAASEAGRGALEAASQRHGEWLRQA